jgi:hypothetical protein
MGEWDECEQRVGDVNFLDAGFVYRRRRAMTANANARRSRNALIQIFAILLVIAAGLFLRSRFCPFPSWLVKYGGDALWALLVFLGFGLMLPRMGTIRIAAIAFAFSCAVEFSQLYHAPWIEAIRATRLGLLAIGSTFHPPDFLAYAAGIGFGMGWELLIRK